MAAVLKSNLALVAAAALLLAAPAGADEPVSVTSSKLKGLNLRIYGFIETDLFTDTTLAFNEAQANVLVPKQQQANGAQNFTGDHHRTQMSIRQSRLGFDLTLPPTSSGLKGEAVFEMDAVGNQADNTVPGSGGPNANTSNQTEGNFFNNPTLRVRHAYINLSYDEYNLKIGQYWSLFGWDAEYFSPEPAVQATVGHTGNRFAQVRATDVHKFSDSVTGTAAADVAKPAEMNSGNPLIQMGLRLSDPQIRANYVVGASRTMMNLNAGVTDDVIPIATQGFGDPTGNAMGFAAFVPILPSRDGKDRANNLAFMGQILAGSGIGALELPFLTAGVPVVNSAVVGTAIDQGIAGTNAGGNVELVRFRSFRGAIQYTLPWDEWAAAAGYAQIEGRNLSDFSVTPAVAAAISPKQQYAFVSLFYDPLAWLRFCGDFARTRDTYNDPLNRYTYNNRFQFSAFFLF
jgi:hypothetical protein